MTRPITKLLVANRGEIALRIMRAARELDIACVAVFSTADRDALHVKFADEAVCIGPPSPAASYLDLAAIIAAAEITGSDAIHPGYGFLSERPELADACSQCNLTFVGPTAESIRKMGDKLAARRAMREAGLFPLPGSEGAVDVDTAAGLADEIGYPVLIKAAAGGGGRGMKVVREPAVLKDTLRTASTEAGAAFGDASVYIERFVENPRHIEFQVAADHHGNVVHLGERECSVQRRYQKLVEESPSPAMSDEERARVGNQVVEALKKGGYRNVGTVELLRDDTGKLWFMEMNTRIQVEHPVTEMVTGQDLVQLQLRIAAGEKLPFTQDDIRLQGHSIECRINAEDPVKFRPSPGTISGWHVPGGPGVRVDTHVTTGAVIPPYYDSLMAKVVVHAADRPAALRRMKAALHDMTVEGVESNLAFHKRLLEEPSFVAGDYTTRIVERMGS